MTIVGTFLQSLLTIATVWVGKQALPLERPTTPAYIVSVAQFRPEKVLSLSLLASTHLLLHFLRTHPLLLALLDFCFLLCGLSPLKLVSHVFFCVYACLRFYQSFLSWPTFLLLQKCNEICIMHRSRY